MKIHHLAALGLFSLALGACSGPDRGPRFEDHTGRGFLGGAPSYGRESGRCGGAAGSALCGDALHPASRGNGSDYRDSRDYRWRR